MNWDMIGAMCAVSVAISGLMAVFVSLMIRSAISEATNKITAELHTLLDEKYVRKDIYARDLREMKRALKWIAGDGDEEEV